MVIITDITITAVIITEDMVIPIKQRFTIRRNNLMVALHGEPAPGEAGNVMCGVNQYYKSFA
jgi:hypothetical protein